MRAYHFVETQWGLEDLRHRRLKIATLKQLNDPFEFYGANLSDPKLRRAFRSMKEQMALNRGMLCFSRNWKNPVQWSHYAEKHRGLCLGFDIPDEHLGIVNYSAKRFAIDAQKLLNPCDLDPKTATALLFTKYAHWRYENEVRVFAELNDVDPNSGLYFAEFSDKLKLTEVIVGPQSELAERDLMGALGELRDGVDVFKARLAFGSFNVVRQRDRKLWWPD